LLKKKEMTVLVTGGTGYIGSHTVVELQHAGYDVVIVDNLENSSADVVCQIEKITGKKVCFYNIDIRDDKALGQIFSKHQDIDTVIHFAGYKAVSESVLDPLKYYNNNIQGIVSLLSEMQKHKVNRFVFSSSCTVYGDVDLLPVTEDTPIAVKPSSPYGNTKKICEEILADVSASSNLKAICLRYFNPIGAHDSVLIGELPNGVPNNLVPFITQTAAGQRSHLVIYGNDYATKDGTCIRDYIHVMDLAKAHVHAVRFVKNQNQNISFFNVGTGYGSTVLEVIRAFENVSGVSLKYIIGPRRQGDIAQIYASCKKAKEQLQWEAKRDIMNAMNTAWKWQLTISK
jgi:UDP-glucose 4-epimerase